MTGGTLLVERSRLITALRARWARRVVTVVAGAGFGKSTLLDQMVAANRVDAAGVDVVVRCDSWATAATVLGGAIVDALGGRRPRAHSPRAIADHVCELVAERSPVPVCLVVDDAHLAGSGTAGAQLLAELAGRLPANGHLLLASRQPLPRIPGVDGDPTVGEPDLAFTDEELSEFAARRGLVPEELESSGRWPALAALVATLGGHRVTRYLWSEVLEGVDPPRRRALAALSAVGPSTAADLTDLLGEPVDPELLLAGVPLASVDEAGRIGLHGLWSEPLAGELDDDDRTALLVRAAGRARRRGDLVRAFDLARAAGDTGLTLDLVVEACTPLFPSVGPDVLASWHAAVEPGPDADLLHATIRLAREDEPSEAVAAATRAADRYARAARPDGVLACIVRRFAAGFLLRDPDIQVAAVIDGLVLADQGYEAATPLAALGRAGIHVVGHDYAAALAELDGVDDRLLDRDWAGVHRWMQGEQLLSLGRPTDAVARFRDVATDLDPSLAERLVDGEIQALAYGGDPAGAYDLAVANLDEARPSQPALALAARLAAWTGRPVEGAAHAAAARRCGNPLELVTVARLAVADAVIATAEGDERAALAALSTVAPDDRHSLRRTVAVSYVLDPASRPYWDAHVLGACQARAREVARALVAARSGDCRPAGSLRPLTAASLLAAVPLPWAVELVVAAEAAGHRSARAAAVELGPAARPWFERLSGGGAHAAGERLLAAVPRPPAEPVSVRLLGPCQLRHGDVVDTGPEWRRTRVNELFALLALRRRVSRESAIETIWPDLSPRSAANNLRVNLTHLLRALEPDRPSGGTSYFLDQTRSALALRAGTGLEVDVWTFDDHVDAARAAERLGDAATARIRYLQAVDVWHGPYLPHVSSAWVEAEADRLQGRAVAAATRAGELGLARGDDATAEAMARRALDLSPWSEPARRLLMAVHLQREEIGPARAAWRRCLEMLAELGVPPHPETAMVGHRIEAG